MTGPRHTGCAGALAGIRELLEARKVEEAR